MTRFDQFIARGRALLSEATILKLVGGKPEKQLTRYLQGTPRLKARSAGDLEGSIGSAGFYAKKSGKPMWVYAGTGSSGLGNVSLLWRATPKKQDALQPINNVGQFVFEVSPDLKVTAFEVMREQQAPKEVEWPGAPGWDLKKSDRHSATYHHAKFDRTVVFSLSAKTIEVQLPGESFAVKWKDGVAGIPKWLKDLGRPL